jgi:hypothetical protein
VGGARACALRVAVRCDARVEAGTRGLAAGRARASCAMGLRTFFWDKYKSKVHEETEPVEDKVPLAEYVQLRSVLLQAEMAADPDGQASVALQDLGQLVSTLFKAEIVERSDILTAVGSLEAQLGAQAAANTRSR